MTVVNRLKYLLPSYRRREERETEAELQALIEIAEGERAALGNLTMATEDARAVWGWTRLERIANDLRYALRMLRKDRSFTAIGILSLTLGIGANAAIFSIIDSLLLQELPIRQPSSLVVFNHGWSWSYFMFRRLAENSSQVLSGMFAIAAGERSVDLGSGAVPLHVQQVSGSYFDVLGVLAARGRTITSEDDNPGHPVPVTVISYALWRREFAADPSVLGRTIRIQRFPFTIIGVTPPEFFGVEVGAAPDLWVPLAFQGSLYPGQMALENPNHNFLTVFGRLRPGIQAAQAGSALTPVYEEIQFERKGRRGDNAADKVNIEPATKGLSWLRRQFSKPLHIVFVLVAAVLLLACLNLMNLQLARARKRRRELAIRLALGGSRLRVARQLLAESLVVAGAGGVSGLMLSRPLAHALVSLLSAWRPVFLSLQFNNDLIGFVAAVSLAAAIVSGLVPAWRGTCGEVLPAIQEGSDAVTAPRSRRLLARGLASVQIALSLVLVAGAFLFAKSLYNLTHVDIGLQRDRLLIAEIEPRDAGYKDAQIKAVNRRLLERLRALPGIRSATYAAFGVLTGANSSNSVDVEGYTSPGLADHDSNKDQVGPGFFSTVGANIIAGRDFDDRDDEAAPKVAIVNEEFARHFSNDRNPVGRTLVQKYGDTKSQWRIVGVVRDMRVSDVRDKARRCYYLPALQTESPVFSTRFLMRTASNRPDSLAGAVRATVRAEDPNLSLAALDTASNMSNRWLESERLIAALSGAFGMLALVVAAIGIYGLLSYEVAGRSCEVGIRMSLGATGGAILRMILAETAVVVSVGIVAGTAGALAAGRLVTNLVFGLQPHDPAVLAGATMVLVAVTLCAGLSPARRAARLDPMSALRKE